MGLNDDLKFERTPDHAVVQTYYEPRYGGFLFYIVGIGYVRNTDGTSVPIDATAKINWEILERSHDTLVEAKHRLVVTKEDAVSLMDDLWNGGVRPSNFVDRSSLVTALKEQIADLREVRDQLLIKVLKPSPNDVLAHATECCCSFCVALKNKEL